MNDNHKYEIFYFDENDNIVDEEHAVRFIAREEDENGNLVNETFGKVFSKEEKELMNDDFLYVSQEQYDYLKKVEEEKKYGMDFSKIKIR